MARHLLVADESNLQSTKLEDFADLGVHYAGEWEDRKLMITNLHSDITRDGIYKEFAQYGAIHQVSSRPEHPTQKFIEFWDLRAADKVLKGTKGKIVLNPKVAVDFSLPGRYCRHAEKQTKNGPRITPRSAVACVFCYSLIVQSSTFHNRLAVSWKSISETQSSM
jgi:RNA recognition motif-containing protein